MKACPEWESAFSFTLGIKRADFPLEGSKTHAHQIDRVPVHMIDYIHTQLMVET
jgi:hypothetical protein